MRRECRERFSRPPPVSDPDMHHGTCVTHVPWCMTGLLASGFFWSWWRGKRSRHSRRMRNPQFHVSGKRPIGDKCLMASVQQLRHFSMRTRMTSCGVIIPDGLAWKRWYHFISDPEYYDRISCNCTHHIQYKGYAITLPVTSNAVIQFRYYSDVIMKAIASQITGVLII